ncbi:MAG: class I SAM-dependent methyltransferase [Bacteroidia bacterium]
MGILTHRIGRGIYESALGKKWLQGKVARILPFLQKTDTILDIGCGNALLTAKLRELGYETTAIDVKNLSYLPEIVPVVYGGETFPFAEKTFDKALLITVLHHTKSPENLLKETSRIAKEIIIIEDIYRNVFQQYLTYFTDTLVNQGFSNMTYQNKDDQAWRDCFEVLGLKVKSSSSRRVLLFFRQVTYYLIHT